MSTGRGLKWAAIIIVILLIALWVKSCATGRPIVENSATAAPPSPTAVVTQVLSPANLVFADGRRAHVTRMNGSPATDQCEHDADLALATRLVLGKTITATRALTRDAPGTAPPGFVEADVYTPRGENYADVFVNQRADNRLAACPLPTVSSTPPTSASSEPNGDTYVEVEEDDDDGESRFCSRRRWC
ncbi:hypothetical protein [Actinomycetospora cinnamomea]|uniref:hypothetical protein n=1 Tax=Actinomycetospora cinnamomea TaxID=663609 RepID=UPI000E31F734|nr:hypothetical protein [Actinomycetospora cinnamomea]